MINTEVVTNRHGLITSSVRDKTSRTNEGEIWKIGVC